MGCGKGPGDQVRNREGVYYQEMEEKTIEQKYNPMAQYTRSLLLYHDRIYTSYVRIFDTEKANLKLDSILGKELSTVKGNHGVFWSIDGEELSEVTTEGTLYQIKGYDDSFRVGIYYEISMPLSDTYCYLAIFEQLNGLTLHEGKELFEERFHLEEAVCIKGMGKNEGSGRELPVESMEVKEFLAALYEGVFLEATGAEYAALKPEESCTLSLYDPNHFVTDIRVYADGYVVLERSSENIFFIKAEASKCKTIVEMFSD